MSSASQKKASWLDWLVRPNNVQHLHENVNWRRVCQFLHCQHLVHTLGFQVPTDSRLGNMVVSGQFLCQSLCGVAIYFVLSFIRLFYKPYFCCQPAMFFAHNKSGQYFQAQVRDNTGNGKLRLPSAHCLFVKWTAQHKLYGMVLTGS